MGSAVKINKFGKFDLNPRGNLWLKDESRFGHKLLSKMGWSQGKGLGKNENGIVENVKVRMKKGNTGVGWSEKMPFEGECDEYDAVLANLNEKFLPSENKSETEADLKSLELRSQQFKKRLHYGKFVRGKDVCRYSEKDMNSIFVMKKSKSEPEFLPVKSTVTNIESSPCEDNNAKTMPTYKSPMSMKEYFAMKMKKKPGEMQDSMNIRQTENTELSPNKEVLSKKKSKSKKIKLDPETLEESSSEGESLDNIQLAKSENVEKSSENTAVPRRKKTKTTEILKRLKSDPDNSEQSYGKGEAPKHQCNLTETESAELNVKKESLSRKRSRTTNSTEKSKKPKLDPELVAESSITNSFIENKIDEVIEASSCKSESPQRSFSTNAVEEGEPIIISKEKRKKASKKAAKYLKSEIDVVNTSEESTSPVSSDKEPIDLGEFAASEEKIPDKKDKKSASKKSKNLKSDLLKMLTTCLKSTMNYSLVEVSKRVSFSDQVAYRTISSDAEDDIKTGSEISDSIVPLATGDATTDKPCVQALDKPCVQALDKPYDPTEIADSFITNVKIDEVNGENFLCSNSNAGSKIDEPCPVEVETDDVPDCLNLPKCDNSNYNSWLEDQRLATRMKLYKNMIKKIKKHPILKTSNMLDLKGYGNWGF